MQKFANLVRLLYGYMYAQPGKKLLFMGDELGMNEWNFDRASTGTCWISIRIARCGGSLQDLNWVYRSQPAIV